MGKFLKEYYAGSRDWRQKIVTHRTPTGRISRVKVASLPSHEQKKYNPNRFKRTGADTKMTKRKFDNLKNIDKKVRTMDVYIASKDLSDSEDVQNKLEKDRLVLATTDSKDVMNLFDDDYDVVKVMNLPVKAIKKYMEKSVEDADSIDDYEFKDVGTDDEEKLYELSKFKDSTLFLLDIFPYLKDIEISLDRAEDEEDDFEELEGRNGEDDDIGEGKFFKHYKEKYVNDVIFYKGYDENKKDKKISLGIPEWDKYFFVADNKEDALLYGKDLLIITPKESVNILYEGTPEFNKLTRRVKKQGLLVDYVVKVMKIAEDNDYDAVWWKKQSDIGTMIINKEKFKIIKGV